MNHVSFEYLWATLSALIWFLIALSPLIREIVHHTEHCITESSNWGLKLSKTLGLNFKVVSRIYQLLTFKEAFMRTFITSLSEIGYSFVWWHQELSINPDEHLYIHAHAIMYSPSFFRSQAKRDQTLGRMEEPYNDCFNEKRISR